MDNTKRIISVVGLGYVGLPVACAFARAGFEVIGFDIHQQRIDELKNGIERTREVDIADLQHKTLHFTHNTDELKRANFHIVTVPTPINAQNIPDLTALKAASKTIGSILKQGDIVVYESTVYPTCTEQDCLPILEAHSNLKSPADFTIGYSPERINPGDKTHRFESIKKVVSGQTAETLEIIANTYGAVVKAGIFKASSIQVAEAAKVIENAQRDLNIAFMNELSLIFARMNIDTQDVLAAASTKWNFLPFTPGLVGGHCIGVDPYYLTHKAQSLGYNAEVILAGRRVNDDMGAYIAREAVRLLLKNGVFTSYSDVHEQRPIFDSGARSEGLPVSHSETNNINKLSRHKKKSAKITILGFTFKENIPDTRNTRVIDIVRALTERGVETQVFDPEADAHEAAHEYGITLVKETDLTPADGVILVVAHREFVAKGWNFVQDLLRSKTGVVMDLKSILPRDQLPENIELWRL